MERLDFEFIKKRGLGELIQDYLSLFKIIFKHFNKTIFKFLLPFLAIFLVLFFFASSLGVNIFYSKDWSNTSVIIILSATALLLFFFYFLFIPTFGFEYMFLLKEKGNTNFTGKDVWKRVKSNFKKYVIFFLASIVIGIILAIPLLLVGFVLALIPLIGQIALGVLASCISVVFVCGLFLYLKGREEVMDSFLAGFRLVKNKFFIYGLTAYLFKLLLNICLGILTLIPALIIGIIAYNFVGFNKEIFVSFGGKMLLSIGGTILILFVTISTIYSMTFNTLIYFSSLESTNKEGTIAQIEQIGNQENK